MSFRQCKEVSPQCPVEATTYGYYPALSGNIALLVVFAITFFVQLFLGTRARLPAFTSVVAIGCMGEAIGYGGRLMLNENPWDDTGFRIQIVCLILSPSFLAAGIYLTLKHIVLTLGPECSRLKPRLYTWIFISCDAFSIILQAAGGGVAASASADLVNIGNRIIIAGIAFQVATMFICMCLALDFALRLGKKAKLSKANGARLERVQTYATKPAFYFYLSLSGLAFLTIFIRSVYRLPEMAGGWGNPLMQREKEFLVLDGAMVAIAAVAMSIAHPGIFFPEMKTKRPVSPTSSSSDEEKAAQDAP
ncbi:unnamed protein product [Zymoseptoria tritici ST99CH_3D1]|nr:unnamed protein product [Zymoseptoria tritici ST99CH_3D1]